MSKLKPCPFCGKEICILYIGGGWIWQHKIESLYPFCPIEYSRKYSTEEELVKAWNTRASKEREGEAKREKKKRKYYRKCGICGERHEQNQMIRTGNSPNGWICFDCHNAEHIEYNIEEW